MKSLISCHSELHPHLLCDNFFSFAVHSVGGIQERAAASSSCLAPAVDTEDGAAEYDGGDADSVQDLHRQLHGNLIYGRPVL